MNFENQKLEKFLEEKQFEGGAFPLGEDMTDLVENVVKSDDVREYLNKKIVTDVSDIDWLIRSLKKLKSPVGRKANIQGIENMLMAIKQDNGFE